MKFSDLTAAERERIATAMHEAGHAVAALLAVDVSASPRSTTPSAAASTASAPTPT